MAPDPAEWAVPAPLRALLWWPGIAFVLVLIVPEAAVGSIAAAGLALVALGALADGLERRLRWTRRPQHTFRDMEPATRVA